MIELLFFLAFFWGVFYAFFLQYVPAGQFLARHRTWLAVVIGVGVDVLLLALVIPANYLVWMLGVLGASAIGIIFRSLANEQNEIKDVLSYVEEEASRQTR